MKILCILSCDFPYGVAYSSRARNFVKLFVECGYDVHVMAPLNEGNFENLGYTYENINIQNNYLTLLGIGTAIPFEKAIKNYLKKNKVDLIFSCNIPYVIPNILKIAHKNKIPYIIEQCEWFDSSTFKFGKYNPYYQECMKLIEYKNKNVDGIISISRLFEKHYLNQGMKVIRIPTILDLKNISPKFKKEKLNQEIINIVFAGSLGKGKENILPMFKAVEFINNIGEKIHLHIYGPNKDEIIRNYGNNINLSKNYIHIYGRIPQKEVEEKIRRADFSFIIRPNRRSSDAGFPTKLAESMAVGTPVIANETGDIGLYIKNKVNGFLIKENLDKKLIENLQYIIKMNKEDLENMRIEARKTAEKNFDFRNYKEKIQKFLLEQCKVK